MAGDAVARVRAALEAHGRKIEGRKADDFNAQCPAHSDNGPSLHVTQGESGVVLHCFAGCGVDAIVSALGMTTADLFDESRPRGENRQPTYHKDSYNPERPVPPAFTAPDEPADDEALPWAPAAPAGGDEPGTYAPSRADTVAEYPYFDEPGTLRVVVARTAAKGFPCYVPTTGQWSLGADETVKRALWAVPYNLPALAAVGGVRGRTLFVVEGEKDVHAMAAKGLHATTRLGSAKEWVDELSACLAKLGALQVVVVEDRDRDGNQAGAKKAANACESLRRTFADDVPVKRILLPPVVNRTRVNDAADYFAAGGTTKALKALVDAAPAMPTWLDEFAPRADVLMTNPALLAPPPVVVPRLAWQGRMNVMSADPKAGKSTLVGQAVAALTRGLSFLGETVQAGRVLWFALDESQGDALRRLHGFGFDPAMVRITRTVPTPETMARAVAEFRPALVVVDALADVLGAAHKDENSPEAGHYLKAVCGKVAHDTGAAFIVIHHLKKDGSSSRGSSSIDAVADVLTKLENPKKQPKKPGNDGGEEAGDERTGAPEPRTLSAKGRGVHYGVTLHFDGQGYGLEKSPASESLRVLHVLLNHPDGLSKNGAADLVRGRRERILKLIDQHVADGLASYVVVGSASLLQLTQSGRERVGSQHPELAGHFFPTLPGSAPATGSGDLHQEMQREPGHDPEKTGSVPDSRPGTSPEPLGNQSEPTPGTDPVLFGTGEAHRFPPRTPRGVSREPLAGTDLTPIDGWNDDDTGAAA